MMLDYFSGVRFGALMGAPEQYYGVKPIGDLRLKAVFLDYPGDWVFFWSSQGKTPLHNYMQELILDITYARETAYVVPRGVKARVPDVIIRGFYFEVETGLKKQKAALIRRLKNTNIFSYVVVPNLVVKADYREFLPVFNGRLRTLLELKREFAR